eukprot:CAMPEP_0118891852 /NCGR_PEP_ID=MMETSP1166-20130328/1689_1 /TAXON_ID=1104430 /ORGANISM="Chrysoreinhardia sp, Strain CCMP3193" /LENGTH=135 /DNA_ID=CAMNT_0006830527 /DNA_START=120 /DNA_END=524 /DNA_ORIENTATION=-
MSLNSPKGQSGKASKQQDQVKLKRQELINLVFASHSAVCFDLNFRYGKLMSHIQIHQRESDKELKQQLESLQQRAYEHTRICWELLLPSLVRRVDKQKRMLKSLVTRLNVTPATGKRQRPLQQQPKHPPTTQQKQ